MSSQTKCKVAECDRPYKARGYCDLHWTRWYTGRPLESPKYYNRAAKRGWVHHGYRWISTDAGEVMEHRHKMEQHLGRKLHTDECVHHKNGDKLDNRLCNLEIVQRDKHTEHHRGHRMPCLLCGKDDPSGSAGLCVKHVNQAKRWLWRFEITYPQRGYPAATLLMGLALALNDEDVAERLGALQYVSD